MPRPKPDARKRAYKPKSTSGCITCKIRRIKCDEAKPDCRRCTSTGRKCDGYVSLSSTPSPPVNRIDCIPGLFSRAESAGLLYAAGPRSANSATSPPSTECDDNESRETAVPAQRKPAPKITSTNGALSTILSLDVRHDLSSPEERSSFHFYESYASLELPGFFTSSFWTREVLLAARSSPAIRYAVVALGAMYRRYIAGHITGATTTETSSFLDGGSRSTVGMYTRFDYGESMADRELSFALVQSNRAIQEVLSRGSTRSSKADKVTVMTMCVLFNCMACLQGRQQEALQHLRSGIKLLREIDNEMGEGSFHNPMAVQRVEHPVKLKSLRSIFIGLDVQARSLMRGNVDRENWEPVPRHGIDLSGTDDEMGGLDLEDAQLYLESTLNEFLAWIQGLGEPRPFASELDMVNVTQTFYRLKAQVEEGKRILDAVLSRLAGTNVEGYRQASLALRLLQAVNDLGVKAFEVKRLGTCPEEEAKVFDDVNHFEGMMGMVEELMQPESAPGSSPKHSVVSPSKRPVFSFAFGVLTTLWWVAQQAPFPAQRIKAIKMMMDHPRREGFWDGPVAGRIAWEAVLLEQQSVRNELGISGGIDQLVVPEHLRIRNIDMEYVGTKGAKIEFKNMRAMERGEPGWVRTVEWGPPPEDGTGSLRIENGLAVMFDNREGIPPMGPAQPNLGGRLGKHAIVI